MENSKTQRLLRHLKKGGSVTGKTAMSRFGLYRLSSYINRFRTRNKLHIVTEMITYGGDTYARYSLTRIKK